MYTRKLFYTTAIQVEKQASILMLLECLRKFDPFKPRPLTPRI